MARRNAGSARVASRHALAPWLFLAPYLTLASVFFLYPFFNSIWLAFHQTNGPRSAVFVGLDNFAFVLQDPSFRTLFAGENTVQGRVFFWEYIVNSLFLACSATSISLFFASLGGYALAKYKFRGRNAVMAFMVGSMMFPAMLFLAPVYKLIYRFGWMDSYLALLVPGACSVFGMFLFRQAMVGVPDSLIEAARIDGAGEFGIYLTVIMPLVRPMTGAYCLITFLGNWNNFIGPQIFIQTQGKLTLPVVLNQYLGVYNQEYGVFLAGTLLAIIPPAVLFFALQKEFVAGLTSGAVKR